MLHIKGDCFSADVTFMAIANKEMLLSIGLCSGGSFKENKSFIAYFITCPFIHAISEPLAFIRVFRYPRQL